jgi:hypothetical protein
MQLTERHVIDRDDHRYKIIAEGVEDGKRVVPLVVHPVRIVVDPLTKPKREILACNTTQ